MSGGDAPADPLGGFALEPPAEDEIPPLPDDWQGPRRRYQIASPQDWTLAQRLYLAGMPAREVAARLPISEHALRKRATLQGWSRRAHAQRVWDLELPPMGGSRRPVEQGGGEPPIETADADPLEAARTLLQRASDSALQGRMWRAKESAQLAASLARTAARLGLGAAGTAKPQAEAEAPLYGPGHHDEVTPEEEAKMRRELERRFLVHDLIKIVDGKWDKPHDPAVEEPLVRKRLAELGYPEWLTWRLKTKAP